MVRWTLDSQHKTQENVHFLLSIYPVTGVRWTAFIDESLRYAKWGNPLPLREEMWPIDDQQPCVQTKVQ